VDKHLLAKEPMVGTDQDGKAVVLVFKELDFSRIPNAVPTGTDIHLQISPLDAIVLLAQLQAAQQQFGWPTISASEAEIVDTNSPQGRK
jgi:hypothetical protein